MGGADTEQRRSLITGMLRDPDKDGLTNLVEFAPLD